MSIRWYLGCRIIIRRVKLKKVEIKIVPQINSPGRDYLLVDMIYAHMAGHKSVAAAAACSSKGSRKIRL